jgi:hypothetical protein
MVTVDVSKKYHNFMAPKTQVFVDHKDIFLNHNIFPTSISVEDKVSVQFTVDNASTWINSALFKVGMALEIKMGYGDVVESVFGGEISAVKTIFSSNCPPQIMVFGKEKPAKEPIAADTVVSLTYGATLNSFTSTTDKTTQVTLKYRERNEDNRITIQPRQRVSPAPRRSIPCFSEGVNKRSSPESTWTIMAQDRLITESSCECLHLFTAVCFL